MMSDDNIVRNTKQLSPVYNGGLGEYMFKCWNKYPGDEVFMVHAEEDSTITRREALVKSVQIAVGLRKLGVEKGDVVTFFCVNSMTAICAAYGVAFVGAVLSSIDPTLKLHEVRHTLTFMRPKLLICDENLVNVLQEAVDQYGQQVEILLVKPSAGGKAFKNLEEFYKDDVDVDKFQPATFEDPKNDLLVISCTSGTTGLPKGAALTHHNYLYQIKLFEEHYKVEKSVLILSQFFWTLQTISLYLTPILGLKRIYLSTYNVETLLSAIQKHKPELGIMMPTFLLDLALSPKLKNYDVSSVKRFFIGGSAVKQSHIELIDKHWPSKLDLVQCLGSTEFAGLALDYSTLGNNLTPGSVLPGNELKISCLKTKTPLGPNKEGEICYKSPCRFKCYIYNEKATKESIDEDGFFHSGDLGYYDKDGYLFVTGRLAEIFKFKAAHISPTDMETVIMLLPGVKMAGVAPIPHLIDTNHPMALVVKEEGSNITEEDVKKFVEEKMSYTRRLEAGVRFVDSIPQTGTGKIKRKELNEYALELHSQQQ